MHRLQTQPSPILSAMLNFDHLEILNNFIFDLVLQMKSGGAVEPVLGLER